MQRRELVRMIQAGGGDQFRKRMECCSVEVLHPHPFVSDHEGALAARVLGCDADRASAGMAALRLDAAERKHEPACGTAPIRAERHGTGDIERGKRLAA